MNLAQFIVVSILAVIGAVWVYVKTQRLRHWWREVTSGASAGVLCRRRTCQHHTMLHSDATGGTRCQIPGCGCPSYLP